MAITHGSSRASRHQSRHPPKARGPLIAPLLLLVAIAGVATLFVAYILWPRWPGPLTAPDAPSLPIIVGGVAFNVPPAAIRVPVQRRAGVQERIDLAFEWPSLAAPDPAAKLMLAEGQDPATIQPPARLFVAIADAGNTLAPAERLKSIYSRYAEAEPQPGPGGLLRLAFRDGTPYEGEDLLYDPSAPNRFLTRCTRNGPTRGTCLYERRIENADLTVRFPRDWLNDWHTVATRIERLITMLRKAG